MKSKKCKEPVFRYPIANYSKYTSKTYGAPLTGSNSMQFAFQELKKAIEIYYPDKKLRILEIGGGMGDIMVEMKKLGHFTMNVTNDEVENAVHKERGLLSTVQDMHCLPFKDDFDIILISHVFEHSVAPFVLMTEFNEMLKENGIVIVIVPNQDEQWVYEDYHFIVPTPDHLKNQGMKANFNTEFCEYQIYVDFEHLLYVGRKKGNWKE